MKRKITTIWMICFFLIGAGATLFFEQEQKEMPETIETVANIKNTKKINQALEVIMDKYVGDVSESELIEGAIMGMLQKLDDPYSVYMDKESSQQFKDSLGSSFQGIGAEVTQQDGKTIIVSPIKNSPAEKAGLKAKDEIIAVDGQSVSGWKLHEVTTKIRGEKGSKVKLTIKRLSTNQSIDLEVVREEIPNITVHSELKQFRGKNIGYIEISSFSDDTSMEFTKQLSSLESVGLEGLIIDVRDNPGGRLDTVQEIANHFITDKKAVVQIQQRDGDVSTYHSSTIDKKPYEVVVLINEGSASASEILAAALNESQGYDLVGQTTFGKGTVQQTVAMGDGSTIKLTVYKWLTPDGNWIHQKGVAPTVAVQPSKLHNLHPIQLTKELEKEMNNEQVKYVQEILDSLGYSPGRTDGYYSDKTVVSVRAYQQANGLEVTGKVNRLTIEKMQAEIEQLVNQEKLDLQLQTAIRLLTKND